MKFLRKFGAVLTLLVCSLTFFFAGYDFFSATFHMTIEEEGKSWCGLLGGILVVGGLVFFFFIPIFWPEKTETSSKEKGKI